MGAQQLQVLDVVLSTGALGDDVVHLQDAERELAAVAVASSLLLTKPDVLILSVWHRRVDVGPLGDVGAGGNQSVVEQVAHGLLQADVDQLNGLG